MYVFFILLFIFLWDCFFFLSMFTIQSKNLQYIIQYSKRKLLQILKKKYNSKDEFGLNIIFLWEISGFVHNCLTGLCPGKNLNFIHETKHRRKTSKFCHLCRRKRGCQYPNKNCVYLVILFTLLK